MTLARASVRPLVVVAVDGPPGPLPEGWQASAARGRLRLERHENIDSAAIASNRVLEAALRKTKSRGGRLHLFGLLSDGGVHSSLDHLFAVIDASSREGVRVVVHAFLDGTDVPAGTALRYITELEAKLEGGVGRIGTVCGRTFGMAPAGRWDRIEKVYRAILADNVERIDSARAGVEQACLFGVPEQFAAPFIVFDYPGVSLVDAGLHFNFAQDGARELTQALCAPDFTRISRKGSRAPFAGRFTCMTPYDSSLGLPTLFPRSPDPSEFPLELLAAAGRPVLRCANGAAGEIARDASEATRSGEYALVLADLSSPDNPAQSRREATDLAVAEIAKVAGQAQATVLILGGRDTTDSVPFVYLGAPGARMREQARSIDLAPTLLALLEVTPPSDMDGIPLLLG